MHRREAALVMVGVPERKLLSAMRRAECIVDAEDLLLSRLHRRAGLIDKSGGEPCRLRLARGVLQRDEADEVAAIGEARCVFSVCGGCG